MSRIEKTFDALKKEGRKAFIPFVMAGDPSLEQTGAFLKTLPENGADLIEIGMPFTDPMADGPVIQAAGLRALQNDIYLDKIFETVRTFRTINQMTPIILMGYVNTVLCYGAQEFAEAAHRAGIDGIILVDLPPEEDEEFRAPLRAHNIDLIKLVTPTTKGARLQTVLKNAAGFIYYVSIAGVTGTKEADMGAVKTHIDEIRTQTDLPIAVGFGIKTAAQVKDTAAFADAVVVGSALVKTIEKFSHSNDLVDNIVKQMRELTAGLRA